MQISLKLITCAMLLSSSRGTELTLSMEMESTLEDSTMSPVGKVAKLLEDMIKQMEEDTDKDQEVADTMFCWCETGEKDKTKSIADNTKKVEDLKAEIQALTAKSQKLNTEIDKISKELAENQKSLDSAVAMRKKELGEFNVAEASAAQSIKQLTAASAALSKNFVQTEVTLDDSSSAYHAIKRAIHNHGDMLWAMHEAKSSHLLQQLMAHNGGLSFLQTDSKATIKGPSDMIIGTINGLNDATKENLKDLQDEENTKQNEHSATKTEKEKEIAAAIAMIDEKTGIVADTDEKNAASKEDLEDTTATLAADQEYLKNLKEQCELFGKAFEARKKTRLEEIGACTKALEMITGDEAKDLFTKTLGGTKRGEKLGSKNLAEFKEARDSESMRSQTSKARKKKWGTAKRYLLAQKAAAQKQSSLLGYLSETKSKEVNLDFLQTSSDTEEQDSSLAQEEKDLLALERGELKDYLKDYKPHNVDSKKLATLAKRTEAYWAAQYYSEALKANASKALAAKEKADMSIKAHQEHLKRAHKHKHHKKHHKAKKHIGLTASQTKVRKTAMAAVGGGIGKMIDELELQQGEETAKNDWCQDEILATEKQLQKEKQNKDRCQTKIKYNNKDIEKLKEEVKQLRYDQEDADIEVQKASNDRRKSNSAFQATVMNQLGTSRLLKKAKEVLDGFYKKKKAALLRQSTVVDRTQAFHEAAEKVTNAANAVFGEDQYLSFKHAKAAEERNVAAASDARLHAEMIKVNNERAANKQGALLQTGYVSNEHTDDQKEQRQEQMERVSNWLGMYSTGPILLQKSETESARPDSQVANLLKQAKSSEADAIAYIRRAEALAHPSAALLQQEPAGPPPPAGFGSYEKSGSSGGVDVMLKNLIDDAEAMVKDAVKDETEEMKSYETTVADANKATDQRNKDITDRNARIGELEGFNAEENEKLQEAIFQVKTLRQMDIDLHGVEGCEYLMTNYATRHVERQEEIDSLKEANAILGAGGGEQAAEAAGVEPTEPPLDAGLADAMGEEEETTGPGDGGTKHQPVPEGVKIEGPGGQTAIAKIGGR